MTKTIQGRFLLRTKLYGDITSTDDILPREIQLEESTGKLVIRKNNGEIIKFKNESDSITYNQSYWDDVPMTQILEDLPTELFAFSEQKVTLPFTYENSSGECQTELTDDVQYIWVKIPFIPANSSINIFVEESENNLAVNGKDIFDFYDDFNDDILNEWIIDESLNYSLTSGILTINMKKGISYQLPFKIQDGYKIETRIRVEEKDVDYSGTFASPMSSKYTVSGNVNEDATILYMTGASTYNVYTWIGDGSTTGYNVVSNYNTGDSVIENTWEIRGISVLYDNVKLWKEDSIIYEKTGINWSKDLIYIRLGYFLDYSTETTSSKTSYDWVRIRKYANQEPTYTINENIITITNPNNYALKDYQIRIPIQDNWKNLNYLVIKATQKIPNISIPILNKGQRTYFKVQIPHKAKIGGKINFHIHSLIPDTTTANKKVHLKLDFANFTTKQPPIEYVYEKVFSLDTTTTPIEKILDFGTVDIIDEVSEVLIGYLERLDTTEDTLEIGLPIIFADFHYEVDSLGSLLEFKKK